MCSSFVKCEKITTKCHQDHLSYNLDFFFLKQKVCITIWDHGIWKLWAFTWQGRSNKDSWEALLWRDRSQTILASRALFLSSLFKICPLQIHQLYGSAMINCWSTPVNYKWINEILVLEKLQWNKVRRQTFLTLNMFLWTPWIFHC